MKKRLFPLLLSVLLTVSLLPAASAKAADVPEREKVAVLRELEIMVGDETGALHLDRPITRAEFTKMMVTASAWKNTVADAVTNPYPDVSYRKWYAPYVRAAVDAGLVQGDLEGYFHPDRIIALGEGATMAARLLGYDDSQFASYRWPEGQVALFRSLGLDAGVTAQGKSDPLTRGDCLHLFYNLLTVSTRAGTPYGAVLGCVLNQNGEVDLNSLFQVEREGPVLLTGDWQSLLPFDPADALIFRDEKRAALSDLRAWDALWWAKDQAILFASSQSSMGQLSASVEGPVTAEGDWVSLLPFDPAQALSVTRNNTRAAWTDIREGDLVYWSKLTRSLYVYRHPVTGTVEAVTPSAASPTAVTVAGRSYPLETVSAQYLFSDLGAYRKGDSVTLLLGRSGGVAAVRPLTEAQVTLGLVSAVTTASYTDADGLPYTAKAVQVISTDGLTYTYPADGKDFSAGDLVRVVADQTGVSLTKLQPSTLTGTVDAGLTLSPQVEILDTCGAAAKSVSPGRLAGVRLSGSMVRCYETDEKGAVTALILNDVTGDLHRYGVMTDVQVISASFPTMLLQSVYTYEIGGIPQVYSVKDKSFSVAKGPFLMELSGQEVKKLANLTPLPGVTLAGQKAAAGKQTLTLADDAAFYRFDPKERTYTFTTREALLSQGLTLTAWYDAPDAQGGRVRIVTGQTD